MPAPRPLVVRCSPDADDLYMFRALLEGLIDPGPFDWAITTLDTDALNRDAVTHPPDVTAISVGHYPALQDQWQLLPHGGSVGDGYGPVVVAREPLKPEDLQGLRIAVPGLTTTAYLVSSELGFDVVEMNASDTRSKKMLTGSVADTLNTTSVANMLGKGNQNEKVTSKRVLLMDEVDGMAGNEDRGGVAELIALLKTSKVRLVVSMALTPLPRCP